MDRVKIVKELRAKAREHRATADRLERAASALEEERKKKPARAAGFRLRPMPRKQYL